MTATTSSNTDDHPLLRRLFGGRDAAYDRIKADDSNDAECYRAERLLEIASSLPIVGIEKLAEDASSGYKKFVNVLAEVRVAILLATREAQVEILRDQAFGAVNGRTTPDLKVLLPGGIDALVEVTRCSGWWPPISEKLDAAMAKEG